MFAATNGDHEMSRVRLVLVNIFYKALLTYFQLTPQGPLNL